jgi:hypothetical protein
VTPLEIAADVAPAARVAAKNWYGKDAGSAQCGDRSHTMSGPGSHGRRLTVTAVDTPLPLTFVGRASPDVARAPVAAIVALHASAGDGGQSLDDEHDLPAAP